MFGGNHSNVTEFVLLGFTNLQKLLFVVFLIVYITTLVANLGMIVLIRTNSQLHVPMYFFLSHLSFLDICYSSSVTPKLLLGLLAERNTISFSGCITQFFFFGVFGTTEAILLAVMAYDRYVAICQPLHYVAAMSHGVCAQLVVASYAAGSLNALVHTSALLRLSFCGPNIIHHFYCEMPPLMLLSCSDTRLNTVVMATCVGVVVTTSVLVITVSYTCILLSIRGTRSAGDRHKAFSTCTSHLMAVALFYGSVAFLYLSPFSTRTEDQGKMASVFYTVVTPTLNPIIYSLRNREVRSTLGRAVYKLPTFMGCHRSCSNQSKAEVTHHSEVSRRNRGDT
ncbi:O1020 protein, partial [Columbina picui]|nr:O1020 protein [Columbina picui]